MRHAISLFLVLGMLSACAQTYSEKPDYSIGVATAADGTRITIPPTCPDWNTQAEDVSNAPHPILGCATQRNLAAQVENPDDLLQGRDLGAADATFTASGLERYRSGKAYAPKAGLSAGGQ